MNKAQLQQLAGKIWAHCRQHEGSLDSEARSEFITESLSRAIASETKLRKNAFAAKREATKAAKKSEKKAKELKELIAKIKLLDDLPQNVKDLLYSKATQRKYKYDDEALKGDRGDVDPAGAGEI